VTAHPTPAEQLAETLSLNLLAATPTPTGTDISRAVDMVLGMLRGAHPAGDLDREWLIRQIESKCSVWIPSSNALEDMQDHIEWLAERRSMIEWRFWLRYERYLRDVQRWPPAVVARMDDLTSDVLRRLEDPTRPGKWDRRGMVAGQVQSGKTANYIGLICKAADAGYRLTVILAGLHNSLRAQTQVRVDAGFLGFDTQKRMNFNQDNVRMGVGRLPGLKLYGASALTNSSDNGDFKLAVAKQAGITPGGADPVVLVVKKNKSILTNLIKWATLVLQQEDPETGRSVVRDVPLLVIDDEADNASVNTRAVPVDEGGHPIDEYDPTAINGLIRDLLNRFDKSAYVGYTATPFANIFIPAGVASPRFGEDLFPRSFIVNLPAPSDYFGPAEVFGLREDAAAGLEERKPLPVLRAVTDHELWLPDGHKKEAVPGPLPKSLLDALQAFVLACGVRALRGEDAVHNSMLVHVTRFVAVQERVADQIREALTYLARRLRYGDGSGLDVYGEFRTLYESDFVPAWRAFPADRRGDLPSWGELRPVLHRVAARIEVVLMNGTAKDALQYFEHPNGLHAVVIGGDKLSRGLTLEGLSVSYYLRASKMYDTLMQMGRWFGYRPNYADVCRLYTTDELASAYREITVASEELRKRFDYMSYLGGTPRDFWLGIRNSPDLMITAHAKMRHGQTVKLTFSDEVSETVAFERDSAKQSHNLEVTYRFLSSVNARARREDRDGRTVWRGVDVADVVALVESFITHEGARRAQSAILSRYIRDRSADGELLEWTVALMEGRSERRVRLIDRDTRLVIREATLSSDTVRIDRLVSPVDETLDLAPTAVDAALEETREAWRQAGRTREPTVAAGPILRRKRDPRRGLLLVYPFDPVVDVPELRELPALIGLAASFPHSERAHPVEYTVNNVYWQQEFTT
jgi:hypothetical protein